LADDKEINITYETLFDLMRRERNREELQELSETFYFDVSTYFESKRSAQLQLNSPDDRKRTEMQTENARKLVRELFEKRERKILMMALTRSRTGTDIVDTSRLLPEEQDLYRQILSTLESHKQILMDRLDKQMPARQVELPAESPTRLIRFLQPVPRFVGKELEPYGPFDKEEVASLPSAIAKVLIDKQRAEEIS
jgi:DNA replication initiation complex subunit (GINS family)